MRPNLSRIKMRVWKRHFTGKLFVSALIDVKEIIKSIESLEWWGCTIYCFFTSRDKRSDWLLKNLPLGCFAKMFFECQNWPYVFCLGTRLMGIFWWYLLRLWIYLDKCFAFCSSPLFRGLKLSLGRIVNWLDWALKTRRRLDNPHDWHLMFLVFVDTIRHRFVWAWYSRDMTKALAWFCLGDIFWMQFHFDNTDPLPYVLQILQPYRGWAYFQVRFLWFCRKAVFECTRACVLEWNSDKKNSNEASLIYYESSERRLG